MDYGQGKNSVLFPPMIGPFAEHVFKLHFGLTHKLYKPKQVLGILPIAIKHRRKRYQATMI